LATFVPSVPDSLIRQKLPCNRNDIYGPKRQHAWKTNIGIIVCLLKSPKNLKNAPQDRQAIDPKWVIPLLFSQTKHFCCGCCWKEHNGDNDCIVLELEISFIFF
jgi:hypothetical protein